MAEKTGIAWTDSTFNPWIGCTKVSPGCDHCYAEVSRPAQAMKVRWGAGATRHRTSAANWRQPVKWNAKRFMQCGKCGWRGECASELIGCGSCGSTDSMADTSRRVFCGSLADVFDNEVPREWRDDLWQLINDMPDLTWLLLTKRIGNAAKMLPGTGRSYWPNVWLGASVVNQEEADRDIPKLLATPAAVRFVSYEPALGPVDFRPWLRPNSVAHSHADLNSIDWIIVGGESSQGGAKARPFVIDWARDTVRQCREADVPVFVKQIGSNPYERDHVSQRSGTWTVKDRAGANPVEWPEDLRVQEFPA